MYCLLVTLPWPPLRVLRGHPTAKVPVARTSDWWSWLVELDIIRSSFQEISVDVKGEGRMWWATMCPQWATSRGEIERNGVERPTWYFASSGIFTDPELWSRLEARPKLASALQKIGNGSAKVILTTPKEFYMDFTNTQLTQTPSDSIRRASAVRVDDKPECSAEESKQDCRSKLPCNSLPAQRRGSGHLHVLPYLRRKAN
ncbi:hypothetical protein B0H19DRAFT_1086270 [Mycena capillaripes]|nr:hypothetical protein B0H19DRAFT_1086270 [Mycena capillaripes]